jgi:hypothetical protein
MLYMGYVEYSIIYRQRSLPTETYAETRTFSFREELSFLLDPDFLELMRDTYGADEVILAKIHLDGQEYDTLTGWVRSDELEAEAQ